MASFYVPSGDLELDDLAERVASKVVDMYGDVEAQLLYQIAYRLTRRLPDNPTLADQLAVIRGLQAQAAKLAATIPADLAQQIVQVAVEQGTAAAAAQLPFTEGVSMAGNVTRTAAESIALIAQDLGNKFDQVRQRILRYPVDAMGVYMGTDVYQQTVARNAPLNMLGALTQDQVRQRALADFLEQGVTGFTDKSGRRWRIGSYAEMAVRSATGRAYNDASNARMLRDGVHLVSILGNNDACPLCADWFGLILSIDGTPAGDYELPDATGEGTVWVHVDGTLDDAREAGWGHPNCACTTAAYFVGLSVPTAAPHYDADADAARTQQRDLERNERQYKRNANIAAAMGDMSRVKLMGAKVRSTQSDLRALVKQSGQKRKYPREQVRWADGPMKNPSQPPMWPTVPQAPTASPSPTRVSVGVNKPAA